MTKANQFGEDDPNASKTCRHGNRKRKPERYSDPSDLMVRRFHLNREEA